MSALEGAKGLRDRIAEVMKFAPKSQMETFTVFLERVKAIIIELETLPMTVALNRDGVEYRARPKCERSYFCHSVVTREKILTGLVKIFDSATASQPEFRQRQWFVQSQPQAQTAVLRGITVHGYRDLPMLGGEIHVCYNDAPEPMTVLSMVDAFIEDLPVKRYNIQPPFMLTERDRLHIYWRDPLLPTRGLADFELACGAVLLELEPPSVSPNGDSSAFLSSIVQKIVQPVDGGPTP